MCVPPMCPGFWAAPGVYPVRKCPLDPYGDRVVSNLACIGLAVSDGTELAQLVRAAHRSARQVGAYNGVM